MLRNLGKREDGYELFEITSIDDLDFASLVPMMDRAWKLDYVDDSRLDFNEAVLRKLTPGSFWVAVLVRSSSGDPVGFELALERTLRVREHTLHAYYASVFTVCADHRRKGLGRWILEAINRLVFEEHEADVIVSTFHEGHAGSPAVQSTFDRISEWGVERFHTTPIWSRRLDKEPLGPLDPPPRFVQLGRVEESSVPDARALDDLVRAEFETSFALDTSLSAQYLNPVGEASGALLYERGSGRTCLACFNVLPMKINDRRLRPIGQLQLLLAPGCSAAEIEEVVHHMGLFLADRGCFAMTLVDMGMIPRGVLESLGFSPTEDLITFAARGPRSTIAAFDGLSPPFFIDFT
jgi:GNAT superfamily N-acetyltransferase